MVKTSLVGETLETLGEEMEKGMQTAGQQISGKRSQRQQPQTAGTQQQQPQQTATAVKSQETPSGEQKGDDTTKNFVKDLYSPQAGALSEREKATKEADDKKKVEELRQKLHGAYYEQLTSPPKKQEERQGEKIDREEAEKKAKEQEELAKQEQDQLPDIMTKDKGTKEKLRGVSG